jgi:hypothetical protein
MCLIYSLNKIANTILRNVTNLLIQVAGSKNTFHHSSHQYCMEHKFPLASGLVDLNAINFLCVRMPSLLNKTITADK